MDSKIGYLVDQVCNKFSIKSKHVIVKHVENALGRGASSVDIEAALNHIMMSSEPINKPIDHISRMLNAQVRASHSKNQVGLSVWEDVSTDERLVRSLTDRDCVILSSLYNHNYLDSDMIFDLIISRSDKGRSSAKMLLSRLYHSGHILRYRQSMKKNSGLPISRPTIYVLSKEGYAGLCRQGLINEPDTQWQPLPLGVSSKLSMNHELAVNKFCVKTIRYAQELGVQVDWWGPREAVQKVSSRTPGHSGITMEPDSVLWIGRNLIALVELEHSGRRKQMLERLRKWHRYLALNGWRGHYPSMPWLLFVVPLVNFTNKAVMDNLVLIAESAGIKADRLAIIPEEAPILDQWKVLLFTKNGQKKIDFWDWVAKPQIVTISN